MEINNDDDDQRRAEQKRENTRLDAERQHRKDATKTFEAKLSEKTAHEVSAKESTTNLLREQKKDAKEQESLLEKIIGTVTKDHEENLDKARVHERHAGEEKEGEKKEELKQSRLDERPEEVDDWRDRRQAVTGDKKKSDISEEGHRRVTEKQDEGETGGGGGSAGSDSGGDSQSGSFGSSGDGAQSGSGNNSRSPVFAKDLALRRGLTPLKKGTWTGSFKHNARSFTPENFDELVSKVSLGVNDGQEFFNVELSDRYFDGLKVEALRTDEGVVVRFVCPNATVRGTFLKQRPELYARFKAKSISVFRIDIV